MCLEINYKLKFMKKHTKLVYYFLFYLQHNQCEQRDLQRNKYQ